MNFDAVLFVHGIVGNPGIFTPLKPLVPEGVEIVELTLYGHGGDALAFSRTSMRLWKAQVAEAVAQLKARGKRILGVGHSMGCLLLMSQPVDALFLMNPPLRLRLRPRLLVNALKVATNRWQTDPVASAARAAYGISLDPNPLHYYAWPLRYAELLLEIRRTKNRLRKGRAKQSPITTILSANDEMVSPTTAALLPATILPNSTHYYYAPTDLPLLLTPFRQTLTSK